MGKDIACEQQLPGHFKIKTEVKGDVVKSKAESWEGRKLISQRLVPSYLRTQAI